MAKKKEQQQTEDENFNFIVRIVNTDIDGQKKTVVGLQSIKGVGKRVAQIVAKKANVDPAMKMGSLSDEKVKEIEALVKSYVEYAPAGHQQADGLRERRRHAPLRKRPRHHPEG